MIMHARLDVSDREILVVGGELAVRRAVARYAAAGARVSRCEPQDVEARLHAALLDGDGVPELISWMEGAPEQRARVASLARRHRIQLLEDDPLPPAGRGHVWLVGGGPGDAELMTVAGLRALADADVVLHDRLGPAHVIAEYAPGAMIVDVGKTPGHHAVPQEEINALIVAHAAKGMRVVRLKGGDPFVFGRGGEELRACRDAGVPVTVVPGVTSAISVPAAAGIPVTHREVARAFTVVSGHAPFAEAQLAHLAGLNGTLVVLMGVGTLPHLVAGLRRHGMRADMPLAILEKAFSAEQRATISTVGEIVPILGTVKPASPAVIVVGEVVTALGDAGFEPATAAVHNRWAPHAMLDALDAPAH